MSRRYPYPPVDRRCTCCGIIPHEMFCAVITGRDTELEPAMDEQFNSYIEVADTFMAQAQADAELDAFAQGVAA
jgi:hypothetical protein